MKNKEGSTKIEVFMMLIGQEYIVLGCSHIGHIVKIIISLKFIVFMSMQGKVYQNCRFHDPRGRVLLLELAALP